MPRDQQKSLSESLFECQVEGALGSPFLWTLENIYEEISSEKSQTFLRSGPKQIEGFVLYRVVYQGQGTREIEIMHWSVREKGKGRGTAFLKEFLEQIQAHVFLEVSVQNLAAIRVYLKLGFKQIGVRKGYYSDGSDAVRMERSKT